jgi:uncharacterized repeat protein (TIGR03917 family)
MSAPAVGVPLTSAPEPEPNGLAAVFAPDETDDLPGAELPPAAVALVPWRVDEWAIVVQPGSSTADIFRAVARMPRGLTFSEAHGDVEVILVFGIPDGPSSRRELAAAAGTALDLGPAEDGPGWMTTGEGEAYRKGRSEAFAQARRTLATLAGRSCPP